MPKNEIDYSNTIIYKIVCNDATITDLYVGHTTNFIQRKSHHKSACNNLKNNLRLYKKIRENGGWDNWNMVEIDNFNCKNSNEAKTKEQEYYELLNAKLNSIPPKTNDIKSYCKICNITIDSKSLLYNHKLEQQHIINQQELYKQNNNKYICLLCDYSTCRNSQHERHLLTSKHIQNVELQKGAEPKNELQCICGNIYKYRQGLCKHKKTCSKLTQPVTKLINDNNIITQDDMSIDLMKDIMKEMVKSNNELKLALLDLTNQLRISKNPL